MKGKLLAIAASALVAGLSGCKAPTSFQRVAAAPALAAPSPSDAVRAVRDCGSGDGGFGAPVRHLGNTTPFSENPFSGCWPQ